MPCKAELLCPALARIGRTLGDTIALMSCDERVSRDIVSRIPDKLSLPVASRPGPLSLRKDLWISGSTMPSVMGTLCHIIVAGRAAHSALIVFIASGTY